MLRDETFVLKAQQLIPNLRKTEVKPQRLIDVIADEQAFQGWRTEPAMTIEHWQQGSYGKGDQFIIDFGDHQVGYVTLKLRPVGSPPDAPLKLKLTFGEMPCEVAESFDSYNGWLSSSWLQEELMFVDVLPAVIKLPRRYCFRYIKIDVLDTSVKYKIAFDEISVETVTSGDRSKVEPLRANLPQYLHDMDRIALKTMEDCMQTVFEDGPKRDRRLWIGDLRLQAQVNYYTFKNYDLVKRCLYLFAGMRLEDGTVGACLFEKPYPHVDDTKLYDYALFFVATLYDYYEATKDMELLKELWPIAMEQLILGIERLDERGIVKDDPSWWCFIDWHEELNKQGPAQAVLIYNLKRGAKLAALVGSELEKALIAEAIERTAKAALEHLWDAETGFFTSGEQRQISWATQVWMVLAEIMPTADNAALLDRLLTQRPAIGMNTPYMVHHLIEALFIAEQQERGLAEMKAYWGAMIEDGADTYWELYNPNNKKESPYGSNLVNSYCHAWSCTPSYFIRKYMIEQ